MKAYCIILFLFTISVFSNNNTAISDYGLSFMPIDTLHKKDNNLYYGIDGSSVNIQSEESIIDLKTYTDLMIEKFKKGYNSYNVINRSTDFIKGYNVILLKGSFKFKSQKKDLIMQFNTTIFNVHGEKIIVTIAYPKGISKETKKKLINIKKSFSFVGIKAIKPSKGESSLDITMSWYKNKKDNYSLLIPSDYKFKKDGLFINKNSKIIAIVMENSDLELKDYFKKYIKKLKKTYKKLSVLEENSERKNGFTVLFVKISSNNRKIYNIFYKKDKLIYILTSSGENKYIEKIKNSFKNLIKK